jgi:hypothetical protein
MSDVRDTFSIMGSIVENIYAERHLLELIQSKNDKNNDENNDDVNYGDDNDDDNDNDELSFGKRGYIIIIIIIEQCCLIIITSFSVKSQYRGRYSFAAVQSTCMVTTWKMQRKRQRKAEVEWVPETNKEAEGERQERESSQ